MWRKRTRIELAVPPLARSTIGFEDRAAHQSRVRFRERASHGGGALRKRPRVGVRDAVRGWMPKLIVLLLALSACTTTQKAAVSEEAFEDPERRREMLEATLRVLDKHPDYVAEMFELSLAHSTLDQLLALTAKGVKEPALAARVAKHLVGNPRGLRQVMISTLEAAQPSPEAQAAIADAIEGRADIAAAYLIDHPKQLAAVSKALVAQAAAHPDTAGKMKELMKDLTSN